MTNGKKAFYESKTVWGFGLALIIAFAQAKGLWDGVFVMDMAKTLAAIFGVIGARDALN